MTILSTANEAMERRELRPRRTRPGEPSAGQTYWELIDRSDDALLDFSTEALDHDLDHARTLLAQHPTTYRNQLAIAKFIDGWIARITRDAKPCRFNDGYVQALVEITGHLRDGDFAAESGVDGGRRPQRSTSHP